MKLYHINEEASNVKFSTPEELYKFLVEETEFSVHKRRLQTIDEIWKSRKLDCWEAVDFQDYYLKQMSVVKNVRRIYISYLMKDRYKYPENGEHDPVIIDNEKYYWVSNGSHSVSMFEYKNKVYYLEVANRMKQGLYEFNSWKEAIIFLYKEFTSESRKDIHMIDKLVIFDYTNIDIPRRFTNSHFEANSQYINAVFKGKMLYEKDIQKKIKESTNIKRDDKTMRILKEFELNTQVDPMTLDEVIRRLYTAFGKIKEIDDKEYILNLGIYGSTAKGTRTKKSPIDIYVFLNPNTIQKPIINDERIQNSLFGVPNEYWEPMRDILVDAFGINPFTKKPYVINVMSEYEVRNKKDNIYTDMLVLKGKRLVRYKVII